MSGTISTTRLHGPLEPGDEAIGNKALNLKKVAQLGDIRVPSGYALFPDVSRSLIFANRDALLEVLSTGDATRAEAEIQHLLRQTPHADLDAWWENVPDEEKDQGAFAVRSSGHPVVQGEQLAEDSQEFSMAGQYTTYLDVSPGDVVDAVKRCVASLFNERSIARFDVGFDPTYLDSGMTVLIQEMIAASTSGVMMTLDPLEPTDDVLGLEGGCGPCYQYVDGTTQGDLVLMKRDTGGINTIERGKPRPEWCQQQKECAKLESCWSPDQLERLFTVGQQIESHFGFPQDVEFAFTEADELVILQVRPITTLKEPT